VLANIHRNPKKRPRPYTWEDFMRPQPKAPQTWQQMLNVVEMLNAAWGGDDKRPSRTA